MATFDCGLGLERECWSIESNKKNDIFHWVTSFCFFAPQKTSRRNKKLEYNLTFKYPWIGKAFTRIMNDANKYLILFLVKSVRDKYIDIYSRPPQSVFLLSFSHDKLLWKQKGKLYLLYSFSHFPFPIFFLFVFASLFLFWYHFFDQEKCTKHAKLSAGNAVVLVSCGPTHLKIIFSSATLKKGQVTSFTFGFCGRASRKNLIKKLFRLQ